MTEEDIAACVSENRHMWWQLTRSGEPVPLHELEVRSGSRSGSPYVPRHEDGLAIGVHLHQVDGKIVGIHGRHTIEKLRELLGYALRFEREIIDSLEDEDNFDVPYTSIRDLLIRMYEDAFRSVRDFRAGGRIPV